MEIEYNLEKDARNTEERGISFAEAERFEWGSALIIPDRRRDYGEPCYRAFGFIDERLHALVFTPRKESIRIISLRRANRREVIRYEEKTQS
ncbi:MAG: BrnT family toxin [Thermodesulfobacteriota bacterium]